MLIHPSHNRVYAESAPRLTIAELEMFGVPGAREERVGGVSYVVFETSSDPATLSTVSGAFALFTVEDGLFRPVVLDPSACYDDDLVTIPKYAGKTNEQFTRLLLNATLLAAGRRPGDRCTVLDPLCGRGTTLNLALMYGADAIGIEVDGKQVDAYSAFIRAWLQRKRLKHSAGMEQVRRDRTLVARRLAVTLAPTAEAYKSGRTQQVTVFHADTSQAREFMRAGCADVIVTDAPYGVAHGSRTATGLDRRPHELLDRALPVWAGLLRPGGAIGISWNAQVTPRDELLALVVAAGLEPVTTADFSHRVDQSITRDVLLARK